MTTSRNLGFISGIPELLVLTLLQEEEMYGYEIVQTIDRLTEHVVTPGEGVIYPLLHALGKERALKTELRSAGGRTRIYYSLTATGIRRLFELTDEWNRLTRAVGMVVRGTHIQERD